MRLVPWLLLLTVAAPGFAQEPSWQEVAKLVAEDAASNDEFGVAVAISGDTAVVGAWQDDDLGGTSGSAYVFERDAGGSDAWGQVAKLLAPDGTFEDRFGAAVALDGDTAVVGAPQGTAVGSDGFAWVFERDAGGPGAWGTVAKLTGADGNFGVAVAIDERTIAVGSSFAEFHPSSGSVDVFRRDVESGSSCSWSHIDNLRPAVSIDCTDSATACGLQSDGFFGGSVSIENGLIYVGQTDIAGAHSYVFHRLVSGWWARVARPLPKSEFSGGDQYALSVAVTGETLFAGAPGHDEHGGQAGTVFVFERDPGGPERWREVTELTTADIAGGDKLGFSVAASGDTVVAGAPEPSKPAPGYAYVFERDAGGPGAWGPVAKLTASDGADGDDFGWSVAIDGDTVLVGATDVNERAGAAYVFQEIPMEGPRHTFRPGSVRGSQTLEPPFVAVGPPAALPSAAGDLVEAWLSSASETHLCFDFTPGFGLLCDGLELGLGGDQIVGWWRNTDCEGTNVPVRGRMTATHAVVGCDPARDPCPFGSKWNFIFDGSLDGTVDLHRFENTNWNLWWDEVPYTVLPGPCPF